MPKSLSHSHRLGTEIVVLPCLFENCSIRSFSQISSEVRKEAGLEKSILLHWVSFFKWIGSLVLQKWLGKEVMHKIKWQGACSLRSCLWRWGDGECEVAYSIWPIPEKKKNSRRQVALSSYIPGLFCGMFSITPGYCVLTVVQDITCWWLGGLSEVGVYTRNWLEDRILSVAGHEGILRSGPEIGEEEAVETALS